MKIFLSVDEYNQILNFQEKKCILCGIEQSSINYSLCVDHNHATNRIRGLICKPCNAMVAWFEKVSSLNLIQEYLGTNVFEKYKGVINETPKFQVLRSK